MSKSAMAVGVGATAFALAIVVLLVVRNTESPSTPEGLGTTSAETAVGDRAVTAGSEGSPSSAAIGDYVDPRLVRAQAEAVAAKNVTASAAAIPGSYASRGSSFWGSSYRGSSYAGAGYRTSSFSGLPGRSSNGFPMGETSPPVPGWAYGSAGGRGSSYAGSAVRPPNFSGTAYRGPTYGASSFRSSSFNGSSIRQSGSAVRFQGSQLETDRQPDGLDQRIDMEQRVAALLETIRRKRN